MEAKFIKPMTPSYADTITDLLSCAKGEVIVHPRTGDRIIGLSGNRTPRKPNGNTLGGMPRVCYHRMSNRSVGLNLRTGKLTVGKPTGQYKTCWYNYGRRQ
jgi:hypothetical protein